MALNFSGMMQGFGKGMLNTAALLQDQYKMDREEAIVQAKLDREEHLAKLRIDAEKARADADRDQQNKQWNSISPAQQAQLDLQNKQFSELSAQQKAQLDVSTKQLDLQRDQLNKPSAYAEKAKYDKELFEKQAEAVKASGANPALVEMTKLIGFQATSSIMSKEGGKGINADIFQSILDVGKEALAKADKNDPTYKEIKQFSSLVDWATTRTLYIASKGGGNSSVSAGESKQTERPSRLEVQLQAALKGGGNVQQEFLDRNRDNPELSQLAVKYGLTIPNERGESFEDPYPTWME